MQEKIKLTIFIFLAMLVIICITREAMSKRANEQHFYKKFCSKNFDVMCEKMEKELW
jgi:hypothetical protein